LRRQFRATFGQGPRRLGDLFEIVVIGGGVNCFGIARDSAGRGADVLLCEKSDLGRDLARGDQSCGVSNSTISSTCVLR
jgi:hypothetical protein